MLDNYNCNTYTRADKEFVEKVRLFLYNNKEKFSMMEIVRKTGLTKTQVSLSLDELLSEDKIECIQRSKKYYISK